ncbi:MAG: hypothetical protein J7M30_12940 [Deltaproteobacteria bacterium]|nr:hypothetical protein [Deltaproteobacteria bacterium]
MSRHEFHKTTNKNSRLFSSLLVLYILAVVFAPPLPDILAGWIRYDDILLVSIVIYIVIFRQSLLFKRAKAFEVSRQFFVFMYMLISTILLSWLLSNFSDNPANLSHKEILRVLKYLLVAMLGIIITPQEQNLAINTILCSGFITVFIQLYQLIDIGFNNLLVTIYGSEIFYHNALSLSARQMGSFNAGATFANKNVTASFLLIPYAISLGLMLNNTKERFSNSILSSRWLPKGHVLGPIWLSLGLFLCVSRAGIIVMAIIFIVQVIFQHAKTRQFTFLLFLLGVGATFFYCRRTIGINKITDIIQGIIDKEGSLAVKMHLFSGYFSKASLGSILFGGGVSGQSIDFEYGHLFVWYGILGLAIVGLMWLTFVRSLWLRRSYYYNWVTPFSLIIGFMFINLSQTTFLSIRIFPLLLLAFFAYVNWSQIPSRYLRIRTFSV